jgi:hypothetical protein
MSKMASHEPFGHFQPKLWAKEGPRVKLPVWLPTTKSRESTFPDVCKWSAMKHWKALEESYNFGLDLTAIGGRSHELWVSKVPGVQPGTILGLLGSPGKMCHSDVAFAGSYREYYMGEGGGFPRVRAVVSQECPSARGLSQHPRVFMNAN